MSVHLLLSAGRGPQECAWALAQLLHRLEADAVRHDLRTHRAHTVPGDRPGTYRSVLVRIEGEGAEAFAATWTGTLCWQAPSPYRATTGRKNWYVIARPCQALNRGIAMRLLRQRIEHGDQAAERAVTTARRRIHDELVRGDPTRVERPKSSNGLTQKSRRASSRPPWEESLTRQDEDRQGLSG